MVEVEAHRDVVFLHRRADERDEIVLGRAGGDVLLVVMVEIARVPVRRRDRAPQPILPDRRLSPARRRGALHLVSGHRRSQLAGSAVKRLPRRAMSSSHEHGPRPSSRVAPST